MQSADINFSPMSSKGDHPQTGGGRLINAIVEELEDGRLIIKRAPGMHRLFQSAGGNVHCRGMIAANTGTLLVVYDGEVESVTQSSGNLLVEVRGSLTGTDLVTLARNNNSTPQVVCVSPANGAFQLFASSAPVAYPDADVGVPISVCFTGGYFFFAYGDGRCRASGINSTSINALDEIRAESHSGGLLRCIAHRGQLFLFGPEGTEVWQGDQPNPSGFPFNRANVIERGIAGTNAVAGWEDKFASALIWVGQDNIVYHLRGYEPYRISTPTIERDLQGMADKSTLRCFVAMHSGHPYFYLKSQTFTHVYDLLTSTWQERKSYGFERWRAEQSYHMFGDWIVGDELTGDAARIDASAFLEYDDNLVFEVESASTNAFPANAGVKRADFNMAGGVAAPDGESKIIISWSDDGGTNWSTPLERTLWKEGVYEGLITVKRAGKMGAKGRKWKLLVSDPVYVGLLGGKMYFESR